MKSLTEYLWFEVPNRRGFVNITPTIEQLVRKSGIQEGLCLANAMHISASVFINDAEDGLLHDYEVWLERLEPYFVIMQQAVLGIVDEYRCADMHGVGQAEPFLNSALAHELFDRWRDIYKATPVGHFKPKIFR